MMVLVVVVVRTRSDNYRLDVRWLVERMELCKAGIKVGEGRVSENDIRN